MQGRENHIAAGGGPVFVVLLLRIQTGQGSLALTWTFGLIFYTLAFREFGEESFAVCERVSRSRVRTAFHVVALGDGEVADAAGALVFALALGDKSVDVLPQFVHVTCA